MVHRIIHRLRLAKPSAWLFWSMMLVIMVLYRVYAPLGPDTNTSHFYTYQSKGFLSGHTWLSVKPDPALSCFTNPWKPATKAERYRVQDFSYYENHFYMYFGPVPALVWIAVHALTGVELSDGKLLYGFASVGSFFLCLMLYRIAVRNSMDSAIGLLTVIPSVALGSWVLLLIREPFVYETAIAAAYAFCAMGALCLWLFLDKGQYRWLVLASLCFGLAVGCRINHLFNALVLLAACFQVWRHQRPAMVKTLLCAYLPWVSCIALLAYYNYVRFGNPFEIGSHYQMSNLGDMHDSSFRLFTPELFREKLYFYLLHPLPWRDTFTFPFVHSGFANVIWSMTPRSFWFQEPAYGNWTNSPFSLFFVLFLFDRRTRRYASAPLRVICYGLSGYCLAIFVFLQLYVFLSARYQVDFTPWMMAIGGLYYLQLHKRAKESRHLRLLMLIGALLAAYSVFTGLMAGYCSYSYCKS